jgi:hemerythrin
MSDYWKPALQTGNDLIDDDHRELLRQIGDMADAAAVGDKGRAVTTLCAFLEGCAGHFAREERLMEEVGYGDAVAHREAHALFLDDVRRLLLHSRQAEGTGGLRLFVTTRLVDWFTGHVRRNDAALAAAAAAARPAAPSASRPAPGYVSSCATRL